MLWLLAQDLPDPDLLTGNVQEVLSFVVLALIVLYGATCTFFIKKLNHWETKYDKLVTRQGKQINRSNRAMEAVANLPPPVEEEVE